MTKAELVNWFMEHRGEGNRKLSVHVVGYGVEENDPPNDPHPTPGEEEEASKMSLYGEVSKLTFLQASNLLASVSTITDIRAFTQTLNLFPYHKILK